MSLASKLYNRCQPWLLFFQKLIHFQSDRFNSSGSTLTPFKKIIPSSKIMLLNNFDRIECHAICGKFEISMTTTQAAKVYLFWLIDPFLVSAILILMTNWNFTSCKKWRKNFELTTGFLLSSDTKWCIVN